MGARTLGLPYALVRQVYRVCREYSTRWHRKSYAQSGEDLILELLFQTLRMPRPTYLDIGAHHPGILSNTYLLCRNGCRGVCVEPDPILFNRLRRHRKRDICLNVGVGQDEQSSAPFYVMRPSALSTFSKEAVEILVRGGRHKLERIIDVPLWPVGRILREYFDGVPNFVSLDTEGFDLQILQRFDFENCRPEVFCIETLSYTDDSPEAKNHTLIDLMIDRGYVVYADTYINTIFVEGETWQRHWQGGRLLSRADMAVGNGRSSRAGATRA